MLLVRFLQDRSANIAPVFALTLIPVLATIGAAVDYSRANSMKAAMQAALDSTALMLSKEVQTATPSQMSQKAADYFKAIFNRPEARGISVTPTLMEPSAGSFALKLEGRATVDTSFTRVLGHEQVQVAAMSEVKWGMKKLELALALDNTGSMAWGGKIVELKKAVLSLLNTLQKAARKPDDIKVAIIPFDTSVRVDQDHRNPASWVTLADYPKQKSTWIGCLADRDQPNDVKDTGPEAVNPSTLFPATPCSNNGALVKMRPLTNDWDALRLTVNHMNPNGNTNVTIGLAWAWHALTPSLPLSEAAAPRPDLDKVIIVLTDGTNTENRWTSSSYAIDQRTKAVCANIKAANIKVYSVRVIDGNAALLRDCASNPSMFFDVQQASQLNAVFTAIAQNLASLRISK